MELYAESAVTKCLIYTSMIVLCAKFVKDVAKS